MDYASHITAASLGIACAVLSVFVVTRRWAFMGEGIAHSGFGGAGTAWLLAILFPALAQPWVPYIAVVLFCVGTALAIGWLSRNERVNSDTAIGIFLVASLAWGFLGQQAYVAHYGMMPAEFENLLFGQMQTLSWRYVWATVWLCLAVVVVVGLLWKEIVYYSLDPAMAEVSGVRAGFIHYLLMLLLATTIILAVRVAGSVLATALLVLPGATALLLARRLGAVMAVSVLIGLAGSLAGPILHSHWRPVPQGPGIVLTLFVLFILAYGWRAVRGK